MRSYLRLGEATEGLTDLRRNGKAKGLTCGLPVLDEYFTLKKGFPVFIAGAPFSGKTEFILEILLNTSILYGWKHFIYVGEIGEVSDIYAELMSKYIGKPINKSDYAMSDSEYIQALKFVGQHFIVANHDKEFTIEEFYACVQSAEMEYGIKFDSTLFDPFNDIKDDLGTFGGREDKYLANALKIVRVDSKRNNRINILVNHIADVKTVTDKEGNRYMPPAMPNEWAGGRTWWRRAFTMILIYRPPIFLKDKQGMPYAENETHVIIQKSKPKGIGKVGQASIFWDWKKNKYFCYVNGIQKLYSCEKAEDSVYVPKTLTPNDEFINTLTLKDLEEDAPF